jgi:phosphoribosylglycinamide formyltransferase-1
MRILKRPFLEAFAGRIVNIHPSLLPDFPGPNAIADALAAHAHTTGCTAHLVTSDASNPILAQESVPIAPDETAASLRPRINAAERALLPRVIAAHCLTPP